MSNRTLILVFALLLSSPALASQATHSEHVELTEAEALALTDLSPCKVRFIMRPDGTFTEVEVLECHDGLDQRIAEVASRWTFGSPGPKVSSHQIQLRPPKAPAAEHAQTDAGVPTEVPSALEQLMADQPDASGAFALIDDTLTPVEATRRVAPVFPLALKPTGPDADPVDLSCALSVAFDQAGLPTAVTPTACDDAVVDASIDAAWRWRFAPLLEDGIPKDGAYTVRFRFKLK